MATKLFIVLFIILCILSFFIPNLWIVSILVFSMGLIEIYFEKKIIKVLKI